MRPVPDPSIGRTSTGMASDYTIREASRADIDTIVAFTLQEAREAEDKEPDLEAVSRGVGGGFEDVPFAAYWVAETADGRVVASTSVVREWSDFHGAYYWWVQSLFIIPEHRGKGLVELLLSRLAREADAAGALDLRLYAHTANERALRAYRRCGFATAPYVIMTKHPPLAEDATSRTGGGPTSAST
jgi:L-amino acid N-acyltransferase YncA